MKATRPARPATTPVVSLTAEPSNRCTAVGLNSIVTLPLPPLPSIEPNPDGNAAMPTEGISRGLTGFSVGMSSSAAGTPMSPAEVAFEVAGLSVPPLVAVVDAGIGVSLIDPAIDAEEIMSLPEGMVVTAVTIV